MTDKHLNMHLLQYNTNGTEMFCSICILNCVTKSYNFIQQMQSFLSNNSISAINMKCTNSVDITILWNCSFSSYTRIFTDNFGNDASNSRNVVRIARK